MHAGLLSGLMGSICRIQLTNQIVLPSTHLHTNLPLIVGSALVSISFSPTANLLIFSTCTSHREEEDGTKSCVHVHHSNYVCSYIVSFDPNSMTYAVNCEGYMYNIAILLALFPSWRHSNLRETLKLAGLPSLIMHALILLYSCGLKATVEPDWLLHNSGLHA